MLCVDCGVKTSLFDLDVADVTVFYFSNCHCCTTEFVVNLWTQVWFEFPTYQFAVRNSKNDSKPRNCSVSKSSLLLLLSYSVANSLLAFLVRDVWSSVRLTVYCLDVARSAAALLIDSDGVIEWPCNLSPEVDVHFCAPSGGWKACQCRSCTSVQAKNCCLHSTFDAKFL